MNETARKVLAAQRDSVLREIGRKESSERALEENLADVRREKTDLYRQLSDLLDALEVKRD